MIFHRYILSFILTALALLPSISQAKEEVQPTLTICSGNIKHSFTIEEALTKKQKERGLMFRVFMSENHGMLFSYPEKEDIAMWMKNTYLPLDILFFADKQLVFIAKNTKPLSLDTIAPPQKVDKIFEINAQMVDKLGIALGDSLCE